MKICDSKSQKDEQIIREIYDWVEKNNPDPEYKENEYGIRLLYKIYDGDVAKVKKNLGLYYQKRNLVIIQYDGYENIYENLRNLYDAGAGGILPQTNTLGHSVVIFRIMDYNKKINFLDAQMGVILFVESLRKEMNIGKKTVIVVDYSGISVGYLMKLNILALHKVYNTWKEFALISCSEIHHINLPLFSHYIINIFKYILDEKLKKTNFYHTENLIKFYESVPKEILPQEYGGNAPELKTLSESYYEDTMKYCGPIVEHFKTLAEEARAKKNREISKSLYNIPFKLFGKTRKA